MRGRLGHAECVVGDGGAEFLELAGQDLLLEASRYHQQYLFKVPNGYCGIVPGRGEQS